tara:strand:+ start:2930 stop:3094 length:165 start_codon:yes stop_codon:yes gene_type:complete
MGTLMYRGSEVVPSKVAVVKPSIASYRGSTYDPNVVEATPKATHGQYRGASWEA